MVKIDVQWLHERVAEASPVQVVVATLAATVLAYKLLIPQKPPHQRYAETHGLTNVKPAPRLPTTHWLLGDGPAMAANMARLPEWMYDKSLETNAQPYLRVVPLLEDNIVIASPALVEDVLKTQNDVFDKGETMRRLFYDLMGNGITMQDGANWFHQRKVASKFFTARMYREVATKLINKHADKLCSILEASVGTGSQVDISRLLHEFTLQTFAELGFGLEMDLMGNPEGHPLDRALDGAIPQLLYRFKTPQWLWKLQWYLGLGSEGEYARTTKYIRSVVAEMVHKSIEHTAKHGTREEAATVVELFVHAAHDGESGITPDLICDVAIAFLLGGRDTTADTLNRFLWVLSQHPEVETKIRHELWEKMPELMRGEIQFLSIEQVAMLTYLEAAVKETLRLYPAVPTSQRMANRDTVLVDGTFVPKGTGISIPPYVIGRLTSVWGDDALEFKPERFIDPTTQKLATISSYQFSSFHAGPRICIGMNLAMLEIKLMTAMLLSRFRLDAAPNDGSHKMSATLPLKHPLMVTVRRTENATTH